MLSLLRSLFSEHGKPRVRPQRKPAQAHYRPVLERLEDRTVPAILAGELSAILVNPPGTVGGVGGSIGGGGGGAVGGVGGGGGVNTQVTFGICHHTSSDKNPYVLLGIRSTNQAALQAFVDSRPLHKHHPHLGPFTFTNSIGDTYQITTHTDFVVRIPAGVTQAQAHKMGLCPDASFFAALGVSVSPSSLHKGGHG